jgi:hypothetical protein
MVAATEKDVDFPVLSLDGETDPTAFVSIAGVVDRVMGDGDGVFWRLYGTSLAVATVLVPAVIDFVVESMPQTAHMQFSKSTLA